MYRLWLSVFGAGFLPISGTAGSAFPAGVLLFMAALGSPGWAAGAVMLALAVWGGYVTVRYGDRAIAQYGEDPSMIVSDEVCGQGITYLGFAFFGGTFREQLIYIAVGFILFRVFDIIKLCPARRLEKIPGPWGVLLDDVMAGIYALIALNAFWLLGGFKWLMGLIT
jgi:phosphatidylglycerophosphatase A